MAQMADLDKFAAYVDNLVDLKDKSSHQQVLRVLKQAAATAGTHVVSTALGAPGPLTLALSPWMAAKSVYSLGKRQMQLYDLLPADKGGKKLYPCSCGKCVEILEWVIEKREWKAFKTGVSATVVGAPFVLGYSGLRTLYKKYKGTKGKTREQYAMQLQKSALPTSRLKVSRKDVLTTEVQVLRPGCRKAQAITATLLGELSGDNPSPNPTDYFNTVAAMTAKNGWVAIKEKMYTGPF